MIKQYTSIIIGAGFSGLALAIKLRERGVTDFLILEKAASLGGTWRENTYPGAECDIPSALYSYSFEPYPDWEYKWSHQPQILTYLQHCASKYGLHEYLRYNQQLEQAIWDEIQGHWTLRTSDGTRYTTRTLVTAVGQLHHPSRPTFVGAEHLTKPNFHSARWQHDVDLTGQRVAVIGNAASAVQFVPEIAKVATAVRVFQRTPNWVLPKQDRLYRSWEKALVRRLPILLKVYRLRLWLLTGALYLMLQKGGGALRAVYEWLSKRYLRRHIKDADLRAKLTPNYPLGAKRVLFSDNYYAALALPQVELETAAIASLSDAGVQTADGQTHAFDVLIYATGFRANPFLLGLDLQGRAGQTIQATWATEPVSYLGMAVAEFPNMWMMYGPNTNLGHSSIIVMAEAQAGYIAQQVGRLQIENLRAVSVRPTAQANYHEELQNRLKNMVWEATPNSWYKSASGGNPNNWPGRTMEYMRRTRRVRWEDFEFS